MKITTLITSKTTDDRYVFETVPPMSDEVLERFNARESDPAEHFTRDEDDLVITAPQMAKLRRGQWSRPAAEVLSTFFTQAEKELADDRSVERQARDARINEVAAFMGVPAGKSKWETMV